MMVLPNQAQTPFKLVQIQPSKAIEAWYYSSFLSLISHRFYKKISCFIAVDGMDCPEACHAQASSCYFSSLLIAARPTRGTQCEKSRKPLSKLSQEKTQTAADESGNWVWLIVSIGPQLSTDIPFIYLMHHQIGRVRSSWTPWPSRTWVPGETKRSHTANWIERSCWWPWKKGRKGDDRSPWWPGPICKYSFVNFSLWSPFHKVDLTGSCLKISLFLTFLKQIWLIDMLWSFLVKFQSQNWHDLIYLRWTGKCMKQPQLHIVLGHSMIQFCQIIEY